MRRLRELEFSVEFIRDKFRYCPSTGNIYLNKTGKEVGCTHSLGYIPIHVTKGIYLKAHRIAWALQTGAWPSQEVDHIDGNRANNKWSNLRLVSARQQTHNRKAQRSGRLVGAYWNKPNQKWHARINIDSGRKQIHIGSYITEKKAHEAYAAALKEWTGEDILTTR